MCEGFNLRCKREYDLQLEEMKLIRWVGALIYNANVKRNHRKDPEKLYPLADFKEEKEIKRKIPTKAEMDEIAAWTYPRKLDDTTIEQYLYKKK